MKNLPKTIKYFLVLGIIFQSVFGFFWQGDPSTGSGNRTDSGSRTKVAYAATGLSVTSSAVSAVSKSETGFADNDWEGTLSTTLDDSDGSYAQVTAATYDNNDETYVLYVS